MLSTMREASATENVSTASPACDRSPAASMAHVQPRTLLRLSEEDSDGRKEGNGNQPASGGVVWSRYHAPSHHDIQGGHRYSQRLVGGP